jgi:Flp pilus assembly protein TadD
MLGLRGPAAAHCLDAARLSAGDAIALSEAGQILVWAERYADVVGILAPLVEADSNQASQAVARGAASVPCSRIPASVRRCLATAYCQLGRADQAMITLEPSLNQDAVETATCTLYARAALARGDLVSATRAIETAHSRGAGTPETWLLGAVTAYRSGDPTSALMRADHAIRLDPKQSEARLVRGYCAEALGQMDDARKAYEEALSLEPGSKTAATLLTGLIASDHCEDPSGKTSVVRGRPGGPAVGRGSESSNAGRFVP